MIELVVPGIDEDFNSTVEFVKKVQERRFKCKDKNSRDLSDECV